MKLKQKMSIKEAIKQDKFESNINMAVINILYTSNWLRDHQKDFFTEYNIKSQHFNVLRILKGRYPNAASPGEIKEVMLDKAPDLTRLIDKLVEQGLVDRNMCPENRRKVDVYINKEGLDLLDLINDGVKKMNAFWGSKLNETEAEQLSHLLDKLRE